MPTDTKRCVICTSTDRPMVFMGEPTCSDLCRKALQERVDKMAETTIVGATFNVSGHDPSDPLALRRNGKGPK